MSWSFPDILNLLQQLGEIPLHANILLILISTLDLQYHNFSDTYYKNNQITVLKVENILQISNTNKTPTRMKKFELVFIVGTGAGNDSEIIIQILDEIGITKFKDPIWVDWFESEEVLRHTIETWNGLQNYGLNSHLYFHVTNAKADVPNSLIEVYFLLGTKIISVLKIITNGNKLSCCWAAKIPSLAKRRRNFRQLEVSGHHVRNWNIRTTSGKETVSRNDDPFSPSHQYLAYSQDYLNFSLQTKSSYAYTFLDGKTGVWKGLAGNILNGESDLSISAGAMISSLARDVRFLSSTLPFETTNLNYMSTEMYSSDMYIQAFKVELWIAIIALVVIFVISIILMTGKENMWWIMGWITLKGSARTYDKPFLRCLAITVSIFSFILHSIFAAYLTSSFSYQKKTVDGIDSLIKNGYSFGILNNSYMAAIDFVNQGKNGHDPTFWTVKIFAHLDQKVPIVSREQGSRRLVETPKYVFVTGQDNRKDIYQYMIKLWSAEKICHEFHIVPVNEYPVRFSSFVRKDSPFVEHFNFARLMMRQVGIAQLFVKKKRSYINSFKPSCISHKTQPFAMKDVKLAFKILGCGLIIAFLMMVIGIFVKYCKNIFNSIISTITTMKLKKKRIPARPKNKNIIW